jgi:hypothetical protein
MDLTDLHSRLSVSYAEVTLVYFGLDEAFVSCYIRIRWQHTSQYPTHKGCLSVQERFTGTDGTSQFRLLPCISDDAAIGGRETAATTKIFDRHSVLPTVASCDESLHRTLSGRHPTRGRATPNDPGRQCVSCLLARLELAARSIKCYAIATRRNGDSL